MSLEHELIVADLNHAYFNDTSRPGKTHAVRGTRSKDEHKSHQFQQGVFRTDEQEVQGALEFPVSPMYTIVSWKVESNFFLCWTVRELLRVLKERKWASEKLVPEKLSMLIGKRKLGLMLSRTRKEKFCNHFCFYRAFSGSENSLTQIWNIPTWLKFLQ